MMKIRLRAEFKTKKMDLFLIIIVQQAFIFLVTHTATTLRFRQVHRVAGELARAKAAVIGVVDAVSRHPADTFTTLEHVGSKNRE